MKSSPDMPVDLLYELVPGDMITEQPKVVSKRREASRRLQMLLEMPAPMTPAYKTAG